MLFIHPLARGQGGGKKLLEHAITTLGATTLDVNAQIKILHVKMAPAAGTWLA
jgi:GNAT superfamily N-acetyltransferase